jgi:hypothetical protein
MKVPAKDGRGSPFFPSFLSLSPGLIIFLLQYPKKSLGVGKIRLISILLVLLLVPAVHADWINEFYDCGTGSNLGTAYNITFNQAESNDSVCLNVPSTAVLTNATINLTGLQGPSNTVAFQEDANASTAGGPWTDLSNVTDGNWSTYGYNNVDKSSATLRLNYSVLFPAWWEVRDFCGRSNISLPDSCKNQNPVQLLIDAGVGGGIYAVDWYCFDGSGWNPLRSCDGGSGEYSRVFEEGLWYYVPAYPSNISVDTANEIDWSLVGELNSTQTADLNTTRINQWTEVNGSLVPLNISSDTAGILQLDDLSYSWFSLLSPTTGSLITSDTIQLTVNTSGDLDRVWFKVYYENGTLAELRENETSCNPSCYITRTIFDGTEYWTAMAEKDGVNTSYGANWTYYHYIDPTQTCTNGNDIKILSFNVTDEDNYYTLVENATIGAAMTLTANGQEYEFSVKNTSVTSSLDICVDNYWIGNTIDVDVTYHNGDNWPTSFWYIRNLPVTNVTNYVTMSLLNSTYASLPTFTIYDSAGNTVNGYILRLKRYNYNEDSWVVQRMSLTDEVGQTAIRLKAMNEYYVFEVADSEGNVLKEFSPRMITESSNTLRLDPSEAGYWFLTKESISSSCSFNMSTGVLSCTVADSKGVMTRASLHTWKKGPWNWTYYCNDSATGTSVSLSCTLTNDTEYWYMITAGFSPESQTVASGLVNNQTVTRPWGEIGIFGGGLLALTLAFLGAYHPPTAPILFVVGFVMAMGLSLLEQSSSATIGFLITLAALVAWRMRK